MKKNIVKLNEKSNRNHLNRNHLFKIYRTVCNFRSSEKKMHPADNFNKCGQLSMFNKIHYKWIALISIFNSWISFASEFTISLSIFVVFFFRKQVKNYHIFVDIILFFSIWFRFEANLSLKPLYNSSNTNAE